jgi:hypothetical protein
LDAPENQPESSSGLLLQPMTGLLLKQQVWGPLLIITGVFALFTWLHTGSELGAVDYVRIAAGVLLVITGIGIMFVQLRRDVVSMEDPLAVGKAEPELAVVQLGKNYELLRRQTTQGFILAGVFMALGLLVILAGSAGQLFGFTSTGSNLTTVAGIIMEFISGTSLFIYRLNFNRLNETSDRLDSTWRVLTAYRLTESLPEEKKAEATMKLIDALIAASGKAPAANKALQPTGAAPRRSRVQGRANGAG